MRKIIVLVLLIYNVNFSTSQILKPDPVGEEYYLIGSEQIKLGNYYAADSLLTIALCSFKNENIYFNRALSRFMLKDTIGFCEDLSIASRKYLDDQAEVLFQQHCCTKVDTIFFNRKLIESDCSNYRYFEIIRTLKYDTIIFGTYHDKRSSQEVILFDFGCENGLLDVRNQKTDMIAAYTVIEGQKYYFKTTKSISIRIHSEYKELKKKAAQFLDSKYGYLKAENETDKLTVYFQIYFDESGDVVKIDYVGFFPEILNNPDEKNLESDLLNIANHYPKVIPAKFFKEKVRFMSYEFVEF